MNILLIAATNNEIQIHPSETCKILISGVGILNTAYSLTRELCFRDYDLVINMGVAGSFNEELTNGDVVEVVEENLSEIGYEDKNKFFEFSEFNIKTRFFVEGRTKLIKVKSITVNKVHGNEISITNIQDRLNPDIESMEGAAVFKVCQEFNIPCMQIRAISNQVKERNKLDWNLPLAIDNLNIEVKNIIDSL